MILSNNDIKRLQKGGGKVFSEDGKPYYPKPSHGEVELLREIIYQLQRLNQKPDPVLPAPEVTVQSEAPNITVKPPEVNVTVPPESRPRQWTFHLRRNLNGELTEITATANG